MKLKLPLVAAFVAIASLTACGGGSSNSSSGSSAVATPAQLSIIEVAPGSGNAAVAGNTATVTYTGWLYSATKADAKGAQFDSGSFSFKLGAGTVVPGFDQGVTGMKVGGKRTVIIPASQGYGAAGAGGGKIPPNSGLVFDIELTKLQ